MLLWFFQDTEHLSVLFSFPDVCCNYPKDTIFLSHFSFCKYTVSGFPPPPRPAPKSHRKTTFLPTLIYVYISIHLVVLLSDAQLRPFQNNKPQFQNKLDLNQILLLNLRSDRDPICGKLGMHVSFPDVRKQCLPAKPESPRASCASAAAFLFSGTSHRQHIIFIFQSLPWLTELLQAIKHWFRSVTLVWFGGWLSMGIIFSHCLVEGVEFLQLTLYLR